MVSLLLAVIYLSFISLGLPDSLLGCAWPTIYTQLDLPVAASSWIAMIISAGTILSSLLSDRLTKRIGVARITAVSVLMTALALLGFSVSHSLAALCLFAVPYGLGAGSVDAALNNYVALHYESRHMSWLHCMWGVGATVGPWVMSRAIAGTGGVWQLGYRIIGFFQIGISLMIFLSIPLWKNRKDVNGKEITFTEPIPLYKVLRLRGAKEILISFFCYCALEQTVGLWASSYLYLSGMADETTAAAFGSLFFIGMTCGRAVNGFLTYRFSDQQLIYAGQALILFSLILVVQPFLPVLTLAGFLLIGLGCAPIYPCIIHSTPATFGEEYSQAMVGVQMAFAYTGTCVMPALFGLILHVLSIRLLPLYLFVILAVLHLMYRHMLKVTGNPSSSHS